MRRYSDVSIGHAEHRLLESPSGTTTCTTPTLLDTAAAITVATLASAAVAAASTRSASGSIVAGVVKQVWIDGVVSHPNGDFFLYLAGGIVICVLHPYLQHALWTIRHGGRRGRVRASRARGGRAHVGRIY